MSATTVDVPCPFCRAEAGQPCRSVDRTKPWKLGAELKRLHPQRRKEARDVADR